MLISLNGRIQSSESAKVSVFDRSFFFGDGVYEAVRVYRGKPFLLEEHLSRLRRSLNEMEIRGVDLDQIRREIAELSQACDLANKEAALYLEITRGAFPLRTHAYVTDVRVEPTRMIAFFPLNDEPFVAFRKRGASAILHPDLRWKRCDIKTVNLLGNVFAAQAAKVAGAFEAIQFRDGTLTEGSHTNVFGVVKNKLRTAATEDNILSGITRAEILKLARGLGLPVEERAIAMSEIPDLSELFVTGTTCEIIPIVSLDKKPIGSGAPGEMALSLQSAFEKLRNDRLKE